MSQYCINYCGEKIDYTDYTFSDGIKLRIPFDSNGRLHICPFFEMYPETDIEDVLSEEQVKRIKDLDMNFMMDVYYDTEGSGLLFPTGRRSYKKSLEFHSQIMPSAPVMEFPTEKGTFGDSVDVIISSSTGWPDYVPYLLLLAYVYFMDGLDDDGKKCLEILEHSPFPV
ncbi:MAG: hypothetical protein CL872_06110, partial [Dehalococcoidaceae bacterium]|nr:hypothetical protein [Dehalococcoidaceae bacterium]